MINTSPTTDTSIGADLSTASPAAPLLYTPVQAARALGISRSSLYVLLADGTIPSVRIGTSRRIRRRELVAFADDLAPAVPTQPERTIGALRSYSVPSDAAIKIPSAAEARR